MSERGRSTHAFWADSAGDESLELYRTLVDTIDDAIYQLDADGQFVAVNDVLVELSGYSREGLVGEHVSMLVDDAAAERVSQVLQERRTTPGDDAAILDVPARRADGERFPVELRVNTLTDAGEATGFVGVVRERQHEPPKAEPESGLAEIMDRISDGFFALDENWEFTHVNETAHELINPDGGELVGKNVWEEFPAATERKFREYYERAMTEQVTVSFVEYYPEPLDSWFEVNAYPSETGLSVYFQDVTERKERELRFEQYETIVETMDDGIYVKDEEGRFTMVNEAYAEMTGYDHDELVGAHASLVVDESAIDESRQRIETPAGTPPTMEAVLETADGDSVPAEATFAMVETDGERQEVGVVRDITERKEYERRIEASERRYRTLVENFPNGAVGLFDEDLAYTAVGGELMEGLDLEPEDRIGKSLSDIHPEEFATQLEPHFRTALDGETSSFEVEFRGKHLHVTVLPVGEWDGETQGMVLVRDVTEQREMRQDLQESEAHFRMLAENLEEIVWMVEPDTGEFLYVNPAYEAVWGHDLAELYEDPLSFVDYVHPEDRDRVRESFEALPGEEFAEEFRIVRPDGSTRWVHARGSIVSDADGELVRIVGIGQDVTERKERQHELERALDLLERTERVADVGGWEIDTETMDVFWTDYTFELLGVEGDEEPPLESALEMYHDDDQPVVEAAVDESLSTGDPFDVEARVYTNDGDVRWLRLQGVPEVEDGEVVTLRGAAQNITERKKRERALEESEQRYRTLAEHFPDGAVGIYDPDLEYTLVAGERLGDSLPSADELEGTRMPDVFPEHTVTDLEPMFRAAVEDGETESTMTEFGGRHWQVWATPLRNADDEIIAGLSFAQDVTEQVEREAELEASNERLEQFAYAASHDLQEPLRMVSSYLSLIERRYEDVLDEDGQEFLEYAVDGADRMREMIDALLTYSRVETRGDPFESVDLTETIESVLTDYQLKLEETDADVSTTELPTVYGDEYQLRQVFGNLLSNALEYSGDEPPTVRVSAERDGDRWIVAVEDEGIGIDPEHQDRVFEVFQRLHTQEEHGGTGIGLALAQRIVERHEGEIWVESEPGEGSTFYCSLPVVQETND